VDAACVRRQAEGKEMSGRAMHALTAGAGLSTRAAVSVLHVAQHRPQEHQKRQAGMRGAKRDFAIVVA
jgi:hypothetical protein